MEMVSFLAMLFITTTTIVGIYFTTKKIIKTVKEKKWENEVKRKISKQFD